MYNSPIDCTTVDLVKLAANKKNGFLVRVTDDANKILVLFNGAFVSTKTVNLNNITTDTSLTLASSNTTGIKTALRIDPSNCNRTFVLSATTSATATIQVSNDGTVWIDYFTLTATSAAPDIYADVCFWPLVRANITAVTGTALLTVGC